MKSYIENFKKYRFLLWELVKKGVKLKYRRSYLGILWTLLEPLMTMIVLSVVFGTLFGNKDPHFPVYILCFCYLFDRVGSSIYCFEGISNHLSGTGDHSIDLITDHSFWSWNDPIYDGSVL